MPKYGLSFIKNLLIIPPKVIAGTSAAKKIKNVDKRHFPLNASKKSDLIHFIRFCTSLTMPPKKWPVRRSGSSGGLNLSAGAAAAAVGALATT